MQQPPALWAAIECITIMRALLLQQWEVARRCESTSQVVAD